MKQKECFFFMVIFSLSVTLSWGFNADQGDLWTGGAFGFQSSGVKYKDFDVDVDRMNLIMLSPTMRFFPVKSLCIGPRFDWIGLFSGGDNINMFSVGGEVGGAIGTGSIIPYFITSPAARITSYSDSDLDNDNLFELPLTTGFIIPFGNSLGIQLEFGLTFGFEKDYTTNTISIGFGVCGIGDKVLVSVINKLMQMY